MKFSKSIITILFSIVFLVLTSCGGDKKKNNESTHTHEDGSVHQNHVVEEASKPTAQETFKVEADSTTSTTNPAHDHDHDHDHEDGHTH